MFLATVLGLIVTVWLIVLWWSKSRDGLDEVRRVRGVLEFRPQHSSLSFAILSSRRLLKSIGTVDRRWACKSAKKSFSEQMHDY
jgi:hypothetical protein